MKFCFCGNPVFRTDKITRKHYCKNHYRFYSTDLDKRSIMQRSMDKQIARSKVRGLITYQKEEGHIDSIKELTIDLDRVISRYIRLRDMESNRKITCYCCDKRVKWEKAHAMHYINRQHMGTRFLLQNVKSGCFECNVEKRGNLIVFAERLNKENTDIVDWLIEQSHTIVSPTRDELKELLINYTQKLRLVEKSKL